MVQTNSLVTQRNKFQWINTTFTPNWHRLFAFLKNMTDISHFYFFTTQKC